MIPIPWPKVDSKRRKTQPQGRSGLEVNLNRVNKRNKPREKLEVDGMSGISVHRRTIRKLHDSSKLVPQGAWGKVDPNIRLENARDLALQSADLVLSTLFLRVCDTGFPSEEEGVDDHAAIVEAALVSL